VGANQVLNTECSDCDGKHDPASVNEPLHHCLLDSSWIYQFLPNEINHLPGQSKRRGG
jgi:hypothetical protein